MTYGEVKYVEDIHVMHTGYAKIEFTEKGKAERNIYLLRVELAENPNDVTTKAYLADALNAKNILNNNSIEEDLKETEKLFSDVINSNEEVPGLLKKKAYEYFLRKIWKDSEKLEESLLLCKNAIKEFPDNLDFYYYYSVVLNKAGEYKQAWDLLQNMDPELRTATSHIAGSSMEIASDPLGIDGQILMAAQGLGDVENIIKYAEKILKADKTLSSILAPYIHILLKRATPPDEVLEKLALIYDITSPNDLLFIAKAAKACGALEFAKLIMVIAKDIIG